MFKIGIMADSLKLGFREGIERSKKLGADGVQLIASKGELAPENLTPSLIAEKNDIIRSNGLTVSALCYDIEGHGLERRDENPAKIEYAKRILELAKKMDSTVVTTHIGVIPDTKNDTYKIMQEACNELAEFGDMIGVSVAVETGPEKAVMLKEFLDNLSARGVKVNLDPANLVMVTGDDPVAAVYTLKDYIIHTHAKDGIRLKEGDRHEIYGFFADGGIGDLRIWDYFSEVPLGQGKVDFDRYLAALKDIGYDGFLTIEREVGEDPSADIKLAVDFLKSKIS